MELYVRIDDVTKEGETYCVQVCTYYKMARRGVLLRTARIVLTMGFQLASQKSSKKAL